MASDVDISNMALAHIGDIANIVSLTEQSVQAQTCKTLFPIARDTLLESHAWSFASARATLALLTAVIPEWKYAYAKPVNALRVLAIHANNANNDYSTPVVIDPYNPTVPSLTTYGVYTTQPFIMEVDANGNELIYTNQQNATARYTVRVTDTAKFSPMFTMALSWHLASLIAGSIIKGKEGAAEAKRCLAMANVYLNQAKTIDANNSDDVVQQNVPWLSVR